MDVTQCFVLCYRRMIESCELSQAESERQIAAILRRVQRIRHRISPEPAHQEEKTQ